MIEIRVPNTKIDYSNPEKAIKQLENNFNALKDAVSFTLEAIDISNIVFADGSSVTNKESLIGPQGPAGPQGPQGVSPVVAVNTNTDTEYTLSITDKNGTITTPNLKGADGTNPTITVKTNTDTEYVLTITTAEGSFDTPNLKGGTVSE